MQLTTFALIISFTKLLIAIPLLAYPRRAGDWMLRFMQQDIAFRFTGALFVVVCGLVVCDNPYLSTDWAGMLRLLAWIGLGKYLMITWWPLKTGDFTRRLLETRHGSQLVGLLGIAYSLFIFWVSRIV